MSHYKYPLPLAGGFVDIKAECFKIDLVPIREQLTIKVNFMTQLLTVPRAQVK